MSQGLAGLRSGHVRRGTRLLVYGASGSCGTAAVQLAGYLGAHVTAVCNTKNVELVRSLGADEVIDYLQEDFTKNGETYDVVLDAVGKHCVRRSRGSLVPGGLYVATDRLYNFPTCPPDSVARHEEGRVRRRGLQAGGRRGPQRPPRGGAVSRGHRSDVSARGCCRGDAHVESRRRPGTLSSP